MSTKQIPFGQFVFERLHQVGVDTVFGLPGDFNLALLDYIDEVDGVKWAGNANELNAAYAADGYSRVKKLAAIITTFGVGELSALNGIAGAYSEHCGLIHIVGTPSIEAQNEKLLLHHTLGNGDFNAFKEMSSHISRETYAITSLKDATSIIDEAISTAYKYQRPVYVGIPSNFVTDLVPASLLESPVDLHLAANDDEAEAEIFEEFLKLISAAKNPIILVDACANRHDVRAETKRLIDLTQFLTFVSPMGKSAVDETHERFGGVYVGSLTDPGIKKAVDANDFVISVGGMMSDFNTGSFSYGFDTNNTIEFHSDYIKIKRAIYNNVQMQHLLKKITTDPEWSARLQKAAIHYKPSEHPKPIVENIPRALTDKEGLEQSWLWNELGTFLEEGDVIISETGTSAFGIASAKFPNNTIGISQVLWGSIGYSVGACLGAAFASSELKKPRRVILFVGDGSLQLTVQEISTMLKWNLKPYLFVLNNNGYTIEKLIHGPEADYNQIQPWRHQLLLKTFGAKEGEYESLEVKTVGEAKALFSDAAFAKADKIRLIEVFLPEMDAPRSLQEQAKLTAATNQK